MKNFNLKKLDGLKMQDKTQITMIVIWVMELFMNQMGALRSSNTSYLHDSQYIELQKQFDGFLGIPKVEVRFFKISVATKFSTKISIFILLCY